MDGPPPRLAGRDRARLAGRAGDAASTRCGAVDALVHRRDALEREIVALLPDSPWQPQVARLRCLRGIDTLTAAGLCAEIGDFERFARAEQLMSYVGLVPSEHTTGEQRRLGRDHQDRLRPRPPAARRGRLALPHPTARSARRSPTRQAGQPAAGDRDRLERPAAPAPHLEPARSRAPSAARSSPSPPPANSPASAGRSPASNNRSPPTHIPSAGSVAARHTRGEPATAAMSNPPPHRGWPRPILDSGTPRRTTVLRPPGSAHISLTARRAQHCRTATHPADHTPHRPSANAPDHGCSG